MTSVVGECWSTKARAKLQKMEYRGGRLPKMLPTLPIRCCGSRSAFRFYRAACGCIHCCGCLHRWSWWDWSCCITGKSTDSMALAASRVESPFWRSLVLVGSCRLYLYIFGHPTRIGISPLSISHLRNCGGLACVLSTKCDASRL